MELFPTEHIKLSELLEQIEDTIKNRFDSEFYWVSARTVNVKKYESNRRCYLSLEEVNNGTKTAEIRAVFWANYYHEIEQFENLTKQAFKDGTEIICKVKVRYHKVYGLNLDIIQLDVAHTLGLFELERQKTLDRLLKENPNTIQLYDGVYKTFNNRLPIPRIITKIALITAPNSDGQRDFQQELKQNKHGYTFSVSEYLTTIQGDTASTLIIEQLEHIEKNKDHFDVVAIVRGGGSLTDFKPFDDYELAKYVAGFPVPIFTGIGHDRNQSIVDLMAREQKTPTKVASTFVEQNFTFENNLIELKRNLFELVQEQLVNAKENLDHAKRIVRLSSPQTILNRGFAIITCGNKIIVDPGTINEKDELKTLLRDETIHSIVTKKTKNEKGFDI
ncbi:MAG TPA: exodeoxyribonuclease VII large subunit [Bacteroidales bacterium]|nr:exodeoxyribonuclease VII large subunit [Bacteroidales bacterium]